MQKGARSSAHAHEKDQDPARQGKSPGAEDHEIKRGEQFTKRKLNSFLNY
jgi:hypothetical protein